jgi:hypothetical protein
MRTYFLFYVQKPNGNIRPQMVDAIDALRAALALREEKGK